jgi:hypothetical protein
MKTEQYSLRDNSINFEVEIAKESNLARLPSEHLVALANYGLSSWAWRAGAKKSSDGKVFSVADVAKDLATIKSKDGEPLPDDIKLASQLEKRFKSEAETLNIPDDLTGPAAKEWLAKQEREIANAWIDAQVEKHSFTWDDQLASFSDLPRFMRLRRLAIARNLAKAAKAGLADLE